MKRDAAAVNDEALVLALFTDPGAMDEESYLREYPATEHGNPSRAERTLMPLGLSAARFMVADQRLREAALGAILAHRSKGVGFRATFYGTLMLGALFFLEGPWRFIGFGAVAMKAGSDFGRYFAVWRAVKAARRLTLDDLTR